MADPQKHVPPIKQESPQDRRPLAAVTIDTPMARWPSTYQNIFASIIAALVSLTEAIIRSHAEPENDEWRINCGFLKAPSSAIINKPSAMGQVLVADL